MCLLTAAHCKRIRRAREGDKMSALLCFACARKKSPSQQWPESRDYLGTASAWKEQNCI